MRLSFELSRAACRRHGTDSRGTSTDVLLDELEHEAVESLTRTEDLKRGVNDGAVAHEILEILFEVYGFRGASPLVFKTN